MSDCTRRTGFDTIRLNWDLGSDHSVFPMPTEHLWYGDALLPYPKAVDPLQLSMQLKVLEVEARGGGSLNLKHRGTRLWRRQDGVFYQYDRSEFKNCLHIETSLPKLLFGHNKSPVPPDMLPDAFAELTDRVRLFIPNIPDVHELEAWRIDATSDVQLRSELEVGLVGRVLADCLLNNSFPVRYPSGGSVMWPVGGGLPGARCYGKSAETGDEKIAGRYRSEVQVMGGKQFRKALMAAVANGDLSPDLISGRGKACVKAECLASVPGVCTGLLGPLTSVLDGAIDLVREVNTLTAFEAIDLLQQKGGVSRSRAVHLVGYSHIVRVAGWGFTGLSRKGAWEARKVFELAGVDPAVIEFSSVEKRAAGIGMVAGGALIGGAAVIGALIGTSLAESVLVNVPASGSVKFVEPGSVSSSGDEPV